MIYGSHKELYMSLPPEGMRAVAHCIKQQIALEGTKPYAPEIEVTIDVFANELYAAADHEDPSPEVCQRVMLENSAPVLPRIEDLI